MITTIKENKSTTTELKDVGAFLNVPPLLKDYIDNLEKVIKQLEEENEQLKDTYTKMIKRYRELGNDELALYMEAQIYPGSSWIPM